MDATLPKAERLCGKTAVVGLFEHGKSLSAGCLRCKYMIRADEGPSRIVVSVPKRHFKRAVKRNLLKRRMREAYRLQKELLPAPGIDLLLAYSHVEVADFATLYAEVTDILNRIQAKIENSHSGLDPESQSSAQ